MASSKPKTALTAADIRKALEDKFPENSHALFFEISNATGHASVGRIDALVISLWPSRGLTWSGYEIKVSKSDLRSEIANPQKAEIFAQHLDEWWLITPEELTTGEEIPEAWGVAWVTSQGKIKIIKQAPKLAEISPIPSGLRPFLASVIRNSAESRKIADLQDAMKKQRLLLNQYRKFELELGVDILSTSLPGRKARGKQVTEKVKKAAAGWKDNMDMVHSMKKIVTLSRDLSKEVTKIGHMLGMRTPGW